jgi:hypothetical protein
MSVKNRFDFKAPLAADRLQPTLLARRLMIAGQAPQLVRVQTIQTNWTLFFRPASLSSQPSATLSPPRAFG